MSFLKSLFGRSVLDGAKLANSPDVRDYGRIDLLQQFVDGRQLHEGVEQQRWSRALPESYVETIQSFENQGWIHKGKTGEYHVTDVALPFIELYRERLEAERAAAMPAVRLALEERDTSQALDIRRSYESRFPLGKADWTGPEPQLSHSSLTRRILYLDHWLLQDLGMETVAWLKLYAAEQHLWGAHWRLQASDVPEYVHRDLAGSQMDGAEAAYWKAYQLALHVDNQETWQRCKGGDHVRRIMVSGPDDDYTCEQCRDFLDQEFLVARVPELPHRACSSLRGCRCRYEPVLDSYDNLDRDQ